MSLPKKIISNTFVQMLGRVSTALMALISVKLITSTLGVEGYGAYATIYEFLGLFAIAGDFGIYTVALREMASKMGTITPIQAKQGNPVAEEDKLNNNQLLNGNKVNNGYTESENFKNAEVSHIYQNVLGLRITLMFIVMLIAITSAFFIPQYQGTLIPIGVVITSIAVFLNLVYSMATSILQLHLKMEYGTYALIAGKIISVLVVGYGAFFTKGGSDAFFIFLWAGVFGHLVMLAMSLYYSKRFTEIMPKFDFKYWKEIFIKAAPYGIALILGTIYFKISTVFISLLRNNEEVGIFAVGIRIIEVFTVLPIFFMNSVLPSLSGEVEKFKNKIAGKLEGSEKIDSLLQFSFQFMFIAGLPLVLGAQLLSTDIIRLISSNEFISGGKYALGGDYVLELLMFAMFFSFFSNFISVCFVAFYKQKKVLFINILGVLINVILNLIFIPKYGFIAAAIISIISEFIIFITGFILFQQTYRFIPKIFPIIKAIFASMTMFIVGLSIKHFLGEGVLQAIIIGTACALVYGFLVLKMDLIGKKEIAIIKK